MEKKYTLEELNRLVEASNGGSLYLSSLTSIPEGFNPTVGGYLDLSSLTSIHCKYTKLKNGDYKKDKWLYCDNILTLVKREKKIGKYTFYVGKIPFMNVIYDGKNYAHCKNIKEGIIDLEFKKAKERGASQYEDLTLDSVLSYEEAITAYRVITGACKMGTERFINGLAETKENYTIAEIIELTKGQYGNSVFEDFFKN